MAAKTKNRAKRTSTTTKRKPVQRTAAAKKSAAPKARAQAGKNAAKGEFGEGNYKASRRFRAQEESFVQQNRSRIPALGKAAKDALAGPEGEALRAAEAAARDR